MNLHLIGELLSLVLVFKRFTGKMGIHSEHFTEHFAKSVLLCSEKVLDYSYVSIFKNIFYF